MENNDMHARAVEVVAAALVNDGHFVGMTDYTTDDSLHCGIISIDRRDTIHFTDVFRVDDVKDFRKLCPVPSRNEFDHLVIPNRYHDIA